MSTNLLVTTLDQLITGHPDVLRRAESLERNLVLVRLLQLLTGNDLIDKPLLALDDDESTILHLLHLLLRNDTVGLGHLLQILTSLVTPQHVFKGRLVEMVIDMVESVLSDVADDQVRVLPDFSALVGLHVANEELDERGLSGTVGTENGNTGRERDLESDVVELLDGLSWVLESNLAPVEVEINAIYLSKHW